MKKSYQNSYQTSSQNSSNNMILHSLNISNQSSSQNSLNNTNQNSYQTSSQNSFNNTFNSTLRVSTERRSFGNSQLANMNPIMGIISNLYFYLDLSIDEMQKCISEISTELHEKHGIIGDFEQKKKFTEKMKEKELMVNIQLDSYEKLFHEFMTEIVSSDTMHARFLLRRLNPNYKGPLDISMISPI